MAREKQPDPLEEYAVAQFRTEFRRARALMEKGLQQTNAKGAAASGTVEYAVKHDAATNGYEFSLQGKAVKVPGEKHSTQVQLNHGRFEMVQGELPMDDSPGLH